MRNEEYLEEEIVKLERQVIEMKGAQRIGEQSIVSYTTRTDNLTDYTFRIFASASERYFRLTLNHHTAREGALLRLAIFYRVNNSNVMQSPIPKKTPTAPELSVDWRREAPLQGDRTSWIVRVIKGQAGISYYDAYFKFFVEGTDSGDWTITPL